MILQRKSYEEIEQNLNNYYNNRDKNIWRNNYHIEMPFGLVNDPNGLSYYDNKFHIFYQWNPFGCEHKTKHWGLVTTSDFITFTKPKIILKPEDWFDKSGCYSGCALVKDEELKLYYTGNVKETNDERNSYQCLATYHKDGTIEKHGVIIEKQPEGYTSHFRDPYIFRKNEIYYMVLGSQNNDLSGKAILYKSQDSVKWELLGELQTNMQKFGYMWECPNIINIGDDKVAFMFSPQGLKEEEFKNQNAYQSGYVIGDLNLNEVSLTNDTEFKEIDMGFDFYAPQVFNHEGKNIMIGWIGMPDKDSEYVSSEDDWIFGLTMPRVLEYRDDILYQRPLEILQNLRETKIIDIKNKHVDNYNIKLDTRTIEFNLDLDLKKTDNIELKLKFKDENISIFYNKKDETCIVDRSNMELGGKGIRKFKLKTHGSLKVHMFIDNSIMEIYYQEGLETTTLMYFPENNNFEIEIKNNIKINDLQVWKLRRNIYV